MHQLKISNAGKYSGQGRACCWCHRWDHRTGSSCHSLALVAVLLFSGLVLVCKLFLSWLEKEKTCWQWSKMSLSNLKYEWAVSDSVKKLQVSFWNTNLFFISGNIWSWGPCDTQKVLRSCLYISCYLRFAWSLLYVMVIFIDNLLPSHMRYGDSRDARACSRNYNCGWKIWKSITNLESFKIGTTNSIVCSTSWCLLRWFIRDPWNTTFQRHATVV